MAKKRGNNEGSIYRRKNGTWRAQVTISGHRMNFSGKTQKECQEWVRNTYNQIGDGMSFASVQITLSEYLDEWLTNKKPALKYRTWTHYEQLIRQYINPNLGTVLEDVNALNLKINTPLTHITVYLCFVIIFHFEPSFRTYGFLCGYYLKIFIPNREYFLCIKLLIAFKVNL